MWDYLKHIAGFDIIYVFRSTEERKNKKKTSVYIVKWWRETEENAFKNAYEEVIFITHCENINNLLMFYKPLILYA